MQSQEINGEMNDTLFAVAYGLLFMDLIIIHNLWLRTFLFSCVIALIIIYVHKTKAKQL